MRRLQRWWAPGVAILCAVLLTSPAGAQVVGNPVPRSPLAADATQLEAGPSGWDELALPPNFQGQSSVRSLGTSVTMQTQSHVYLWSAITRAWTIVPVAPGAQVIQFNAFVLVVDGTTLHGYATRTGKLETLTLAAVPTLHHASVSSCWMALAEVGTDLWAFGAFDGTWHHQTLALPGPEVVVGQTVAMVRDGGDIYGVSANVGDFVPGPSLQAGSSVRANGDVGIAWDSQQVVGFSAHLNRWASQSLPAAQLLSHQRGYAMFEGAGDLWAYSPCTGDFVSVQPPAGYQLDAGRYVALVESGGPDVVAYSSGQNRFVARTLQSAPQVDVNDEVLLVQDSTGVLGFSVVRGEFSQLLPGTYSTNTNAAMVWAENGAQGFALNLVEGTWSDPLVLTSQSQRQVLRNVVVVADTAGYQALSGRHGKWHSQACQTSFQFLAPTSGDVFVALDGVRSYLFDPVLDRWSGTVHGPAWTDHDVWRQTIVAFDGRALQGFGLMNNVWSSRAIRGNFVGLDANSSCGYALTDTHLYTYSAHGSLSTFSRFPEFSRLQPIAAPLHLLQTAPAGSQVFVTMGLRPTFQLYASLGMLFVDPTSVVRRFPMGTVPADGWIDFVLPLGAASALRGRPLHIQTLVIEPSGRAWLGNSVAPILL